MAQTAKHSSQSLNGRKKSFRHGLVTLLTVVMMAGQALAMDLASAKTQGLVGERPDGLIGAVGAPSADIAAMVDKINAERMQEYRDIAAGNGTDVRQVQALAGKKLISQTPGGQYIMNAAGVWQKKP